MGSEKSDGRFWFDMYQLESINNYGGGGDKEIDLNTIIALPITP